MSEYKNDGWSASMAAQEQDKLTRGIYLYRSTIAFPKKHPTNNPSPNPKQRKQTASHSKQRVEMDGKRVWLAFQGAVRV